MSNKDKINNGKMILANGETYIDTLEKRMFGRPPQMPYEYEEARENMRTWVGEMKTELKKYSNKKILNDSFIFSIKMNEAFGAKSYFPKKLISDAKSDFVGSRKLNEDGVSRKLIYARGNEDSLNQLSKNLDVAESKLTEVWKSDIQKLEQISFLDEENIFEGFEKNWSKGRVEMILHPMGDFDQEAEDMLRSILIQEKFEPELLHIAKYGKNELKFISAFLNKNQLNALKHFNPLRSIHPMSGYDIPRLRGAISKKKFPSVESNSEKSVIKVGMFDGGVDEDHPLLKGHVKENILTKAEKNEVNEYVEHGNAVAGAMLFGDLSEYGEKTVLPRPKVFVESFRILPLKNEKDINLYEVIDHIESIVPSREDIKVYNLSFGPRGPIYEDNVSRFTYVLDRLANEYKVLFVVAVGNDGEQEEPFNRIQAPSDLINGISVGAYSFKKEGSQMKRERASYSCVGPGREGAQTKPDVVAFGGCSQVLMQLIGRDKDFRLFDAGTSFASPLVASLVGELVGRCNQIKPITARALLAHKATHPEGKPCVELGNGFAPMHFDDIMKCDDQNYTVLFQSELMPGKFAKLPIPLPDLSEVKGNVEISWTISVLSSSDLKNSEEYSSVSIDDVFYPHSNKYKFYREKSDGKRETKTINIETDKESADGLILEGWRKPSLPDTDDTNSLYLSEEKRKANLKWDATFSRSKTKRASSLTQPFLSLHALERNLLEDSYKRVNYSVAITVKIPKFEGDIYAEVSKTYNKLSPVEVRNINEVVVAVR